MNEEDVRTLVMRRLEQAETALGDAQFLLDGGRSPQSVINRAYYAMFYAVLALLQQTGTVPSKHTGAISLFDREFVARGVFSHEMSRQLHQAFELRQTSDYKATESPLDEQARDAVGHAAHFLKVVRDHLQQRLPGTG